MDPEKVQRIQSVAAVSEIGTVPGQIDNLSHRVAYCGGHQRDRAAVITRYAEFNPRTFSFHKDPVLVLEDFWAPEERKLFQGAMSNARWKSLSEMAEVSAAFPRCGNWLKAEIAQAEAKVFLDRLALPCIAEYMESFPDIKQRHLSFSFYSYGAGDCLSTHDDTDEAYSRDRQAYRALRRVALATYLHEDWQPDWGGELIIYDARKKQDQRALEIKHCLLPRPGSLVLFTVPRFHRVCRVDELAGTNKRLSIAGWFMTEHEH